MKYCLAALFTVIFCLSSLQAQEYDAAIGGRLGVPFGVTYKQFISPTVAGEAIIGFRYGFTFTGLIEGHSDLFGQGLYLVYGIGGHIGTFNNPVDINTGHVLDAGADAIVGLEYAMYRTPICFGIDFKPALTYRNNDVFYVSHGGLSVRYTF